MVAPCAAINLIAAGTPGAAIFIPVTNAIDRTVKDAAVKVFHYDTLESLSAHV
jgi:hypothetical protein